MYSSHAIDCVHRANYEIGRWYVHGYGVYIPHFKLKYLIMNIAAYDADRRLEADAG